MEVSPGQHLVMTSFDDYSIAKLKLADGSVVYRHELSKVQWPCGISCHHQDGSTLTVDMESHTLHVISPQGGWVKQVWSQPGSDDKEDGLWNVSFLNNLELLRRSKSSRRVHGHTVNAGGDFLGYDVTFLDSIVTGDETWLHPCTPETKQDSMTWKHPSSPVEKKLKVRRSAKKIMGTVFWDSRVVLMFETLQPGETINAARYCQTLDKLREAVRRKRPGQLTNGVILPQDNATAHSARVTQGWLEKYGWEILPHPPHSPDLAPSDYHLFGPLKSELAGKRFDDDEELVDHVRKWLQNLDGSFLREGIYSMVRRWQKGVDRLGCYVEK
ncbi:histone-lysine N-methyltransferase SETMAR [Elysia marginata]|uniref:Histone-lysine N-methyltransferase SETMAR n=1 Tax=Elysia marginata TaxID=1093978 RepID=A0AAV4EY50_9GAST|nr:histone-lysine N-methyltransferase SETMAR [Elysia marginata]